MKIYVKTLTGKSITIDVECNSTIRAVMEAIEEKEGLPSEYQRLSFCGMLLGIEPCMRASMHGEPIDDFKGMDSTLADYNIQKESTITLCTRLRGD